MVKEEKLKQVEETKVILNSYKVIGIIDLHKLPSKQLQEIRKRVRDNGIVKVVKKTILLNAIKGLGSEIVELEKFIPQQPGLVLSNLDAFKFYLNLSKLKSPHMQKKATLLMKKFSLLPVQRVYWQDL